MKFHPINKSVTGKRKAPASESARDDRSIAEPNRKPDDLLAALVLRLEMEYRRIKDQVRISSLFNCIWVS